MEGRREAGGGRRQGRQQERRQGRRHTYLVAFPQRRDVGGGTAQNGEGTRRRELGQSASLGNVSSHRFGLEKGGRKG